MCQCNAFCFIKGFIKGLGQNEYSKFRVTVSFKKRSNYTYHKVKFFSFPCQSVWLSHHPRTTIVKIFQSVEVPYVKRSIFSRQFQLCQSSNELLEEKKGFQGSFSVAKVTLQSQMWKFSHMKKSTLWLIIYLSQSILSTISL